MWKDNKTFLLICSGVTGFLVATIFLYVAKLLPSNMADWFSAIGSIAAIFFIIIQINQQADQHNDQKGHNLEIAIGKRPVNEKDESGAIKTSTENNLVFFGTNSGMSPSSFKYIGVCVSEDYEKLKRNHEMTKRDHQPYDDPYVDSMDLFIELGVKTQPFERVLPGEISNETIVPYKKIQATFKGNCNNLYVIYMDVLGTIYGRHFVVAEADEKN